MKTSSDHITLAHNIIRSHKDAESVIRKLEVKRPTFIAQLSMIGDSRDVMLENISDADQRLYRRYLEAKDHLDIYRVAMEERVSQRNRSIIHDTFDNGISVAEAAKKYGLSSRTIKRARRRGIKAIAEEIMLREAVKREIE